MADASLFQIASIGFRQVEMGALVVGGWWLVARSWWLDEEGGWVGEGSVDGADNRFSNFVTAGADGRS
jgi:hypothetical protein